MAVRPSDATAKDAKSYEVSALQMLIRAVQAILSDPPEPTTESLQALYSLCEGLVGTASTQSQTSVSQTLYDRTRIQIERKVGEYATALSRTVLDSVDGEGWLTQLDTIWHSFNEKMVSILWVRASYPGRLDINSSWCGRFCCTWTGRLS